MELTTEFLKNGGVYKMSSDDHVLEVEWVTTISGKKRYRLWFNGLILKLTKRLSPIKLKVGELSKEYGMTPDETFDI